MSAFSEYCIVLYSEHRQTSLSCLAEMHFYLYLFFAFYSNKDRCQNGTLAGSPWSGGESQRSAART